MQEVNSEYRGLIEQFDRLCRCHFINKFPVPALLRLYLSFILIFYGNNPFSNKEQREEHIKNKKDDIETRVTVVLEVLSVELVLMEVFSVGLVLKEVLSVEIVLKEVLSVETVLN